MNLQAEIRAIAVKMIESGNKGDIPLRKIGECDSDFYTNTYGQILWVNGECLGLDEKIVINKFGREVDKYTMEEKIHLVINIIDWAAMPS
jgi:hypothetical protein